MHRRSVLAAAVSGALAARAPAKARPAGLSGRWEAEKARAWYAGQPWLSGANFLPSGAVNQLAMFQAASFDPDTIERELGWARATFGMNAARVYLHDLLWEQDAAGFTGRLDRFLAIAAAQGIRSALVLFDSCWDPDPVLGTQRPPVPGVHNSRWVQSPGRRDLVRDGRETHFRSYVEGIVGAFARDERVLLWDIWNEPDNPGGGAYDDRQLAGEAARIETLLPQAFGWARSQAPVQPLTSGLWRGRDWSPRAGALNAIQRTQIEASDVLSFHNYENAASFEARLGELRPYGRPILCTEWMARSNGSTVAAILPLARRENVAMINWGLVDGASQTRLPWDSWQRPFVDSEPAVWFHDLLRRDGRPYDEREAELFRAARRGT